MRQGLILKVFLVVIGIAIILRVFVLDIVFISNNDLEPHFLAGDAILILKLSSPHPGRWVLLEDHPSSGNYSLRRLAHEVTQGEWAFSGDAGEENEMLTVSARKILGRAVMILWSRPCPTYVDGCARRSSKFLSVIN